MPELSIPCPTPFHFRDVVFSHGWLRLPPYRWDADTETLSRLDLLPDGSPVRWSLRAVAGPTPGAESVRLEAEGPVEALPGLERAARWILALDEDLGEFHALCAEDPGLRQAVERGQGRILRSPTAWEDLVKTLFTVNTRWAQTVRMTGNLVEHYGAQHPDGDRAFPGPEAIAPVDPAELQERCRAGYRAEPLSLLARAAAEGRLDLEALKDPALPPEEVESRLLALRGIGPYAAANMLMLLGQYDHLPVDSWFRTTVRAAWFGGRAEADRELVAAFERFRPYRTLAYQFYDWQGAMRTEVWTAPEE